MTPKYLLEWVDLSLLGLSRVFRIKINSFVLCGQDLKIVPDCPSWLYPGWLSDKTNRLCCVMWRRFENLIKSFMLGFHVFFLSFPCQDRWTLLCHEIFTKPRFRNTVKLSFLSLTCLCGVFLIWIDGPLGGS